MNVIGIDIGGTKISSAVFNEDGYLLKKTQALVEKRKGAEIAALVINQIQKLLNYVDDTESLAIGCSVPGIYYHKTGHVWAPNIAGWDDYPLLQELKSVYQNTEIVIDSDRACYILGETWAGNARNCNDAIFMAVGTGIGAGIMINGVILRGHSDIAGAVGWLALEPPYLEKYDRCGCFEYSASGDGLARVARDLLSKQKTYRGYFSDMPLERISSHDVFKAYEHKDPVAIKAMQKAITLWGMTVANLVSIFNPQKIILGGGVFGPAQMFLEQIKQEATKWAQPISIKQLSLEVSALGADAGLYGAGRLAIGKLKHI